MPYLSARPAKGRIVQGFGPRPKPTPTSPAIHYGQDYGWGGGDALYAARAGRVAGYAYSGAYGNRMIIDHGHGIQTWYCHTTSAAKGVEVGDQVAAGQQVAWMGATGNVTGKHLHFEVRENGKAVDPEPLFSSGTAGGGTTPLPEIGNDMPLDAADKSFMNVMGASIVQQIKDAIGPEVWGESLTHKSGVSGPASEWVVNTSDAVAAATAGIERIVAAIEGKLPASSGGGTITTAQITAAVTEGIRAVAFTGTITAKE